ncbi:MAG: HAD family hydrolase [Negativicutes bacterium]|jgi:hypothetical protein
MSKIKLIVSDFDGTLFRSDKTLSERTVQIAKRCEQTGVIFTVATGRMYRTIAPYINQLGITAPVIAYNGACIVHDGRELFSRTVPKDAAMVIMEIFKTNNWNLLSFVNDKLQTNRLSDAVQDNYLRNLELPLVEMGERFWNYYEPSFKYLSCVTDNDLAQQMGEALKERLGQTVNFVYTCPHFQIMAPEITKASGLRWLAEYYNIAMENVAAFGDEANDIEMITEAGYGYAVANATEELLAVAKVVVGSNDEDGVAEKIDELLAQ